MAIGEFLTVFGVLLRCSSRDWPLMKRHSDPDEVKDPCLLLNDVNTTVPDIPEKDSDPVTFANFEINNSASIVIMPP
jgi:hypothetical protein